MGLTERDHQWGLQRATIIGTRRERPSPRGKFRELALCKYKKLYLQDCSSKQKIEFLIKFPVGFLHPSEQMPAEYYATELNRLFQYRSLFKICPSRVLE
jgi:hypothetical protein